MIFLSVILSITALWIPANAYYYYDYYGGASVVDGVGGVAVGILGLSVLLSAVGGLGGGLSGGTASCPSCPVMSCPGAVCSTALTCGAGYTERTVNGAQTCYQILSGPFAIFLRAQEACANTGGSLVSISNAAERIIIQELLLASGTDPLARFYTGVRDLGGPAGATNPLTNICTGMAPDSIGVGLTNDNVANNDCVWINAGAIGRDFCNDFNGAVCEQGLNNMCTCTATTGTG